MVIGIGLDLVETARVRRALERHGERFVRKLMDPEEAASLPGEGAERVRALALAIAGKEAAEGFQFLSPPVPKDLDTAEAKAYVASYKAKYGEAPGSIYGVLAGDGFRVVAKAIEATKSTNPDKIREYFTSGLKNFPGFTGKIAFNAKGDRVGELYRVYKVDKAGEFVLQP